MYAKALLQNGKQVDHPELDCPCDNFLNENNPLYNETQEFEQNLPGEFVGRKAETTMNSQPKFV